MGSTVPPPWSSTTPGRTNQMVSAQSRRYRQFLERLRAARLQVGLTQEQVAKGLRKPQSFISKCESGERKVDAVELEDFARIYGKGVRFFLPGFPKS